MSTKKRLDVIVVELGLLPSRQAAQAAIMDGGVFVDGVKSTKPGVMIKDDSTVELAPNWGSSKYVSRGGLKLEKALDQFEIAVEKRVCLDVGASTGGFTDCLLKRGASHVYAVDVGYGQLDWSLRKDSRVTVKERVNARFLTPDMLYENETPRANLVVMDVSFISILKILPAVLQCIDEANADIIPLIKPQFEAGKGAVGKGGVVREAKTHVQVLKDVIAQTNQLDLHACALTYSPVTGPAGNMEFLAHFRIQSQSLQSISIEDIEQVVAEAHRVLDKTNPDQTE